MVTPYVYQEALMPKRTSKKPPSSAAERVERCRRELKKSGAGALLVTNPADYFYLTGFTGEDSAALLTPRDVHVLTDGRFEQEAAKEVPWADVRMRKGSLTDEIAKTCRALRIRRLGVQRDHFTLGALANLKKQLNGLRIDAGPAVFEQLRRYKETSELTAMKKAIDVAQNAFLAMRKTIRVGQTELEMAARLEYEMNRRGSTAPAFPTICAEGPNSASPHAVPGNRRVNKGSAILFYWGARVGRYCSDLCRVVFVDSIPRKFAEVYEVVLEAQLVAIDAVRPGARMCDVDEIGRASCRERV